MQHDDEEEEKTIQSPGFKSSEGFTFEQVKDQQFVTNRLSPMQTARPETIEEIELDGILFRPMPKCPWPLAEEPKPYRETELFIDVRDFTKQHLFLEDERQYDVIAAWILATWIPEFWEVVPYIFFYGPVASGKTRALEVIQRLSYRSILASNISSAALFRACDQWKPTLILDETEIYNKIEKGEIIGLLNSGYRRGQCAIRARSTDSGVMLEQFNVFGPKALAGTEGLAKTLESRCILIKTIRNRRKVPILINDKKATELRNKLLMFRLITLRPENEDCGVSGVCGVFQKRASELKVEDGRLTELFLSLVSVACEGRENIISYAETLFKERRFEENASLEADIVKILSESDFPRENNIVLTKDIADKLNEGRSEKDCFKLRSIGWVMRRLGFSQRRLARANGWFLDTVRLKNLMATYLSAEECSEDSGKNSTNITNSTNVENPESKLEPKTDIPTTQEGLYSCECCRALSRASFFATVADLKAHISTHHENSEYVR